MSYNDLRKGRFSEPGREYFFTAVVHGRRPVFLDFHAARCVVRTLRSLEGERDAEWLAWVVMPDHFHALLRLGHVPLCVVMAPLKGWSARRVNRLRGSAGRLWQPGYSGALRRDEDRRAVARYLVANPLRAGLVRHIGEYPHWNSIWLQGGRLDSEIICCRPGGPTHKGWLGTRMWVGLQPHGMRRRLSA